MMDREKQKVFAEGVCYLTKGLASVPRHRCVKGQSLILGSDWKPIVGRLTHARQGCNEMPANEAVGTCHVSGNRVM